MHAASDPAVFSAVDFSVKWASTHAHRGWWLLGWWWFSSIWSLRNIWSFFISRYFIHELVLASLHILPYLDLFSIFSNKYFLIGIRALLYLLVIFRSSICRIDKVNRFLLQDLSFLSLQFWLICRVELPDFYETLWSLGSIFTELRWANVDDCWSVFEIRVATVASQPILSGGPVRSVHIAQRSTESFTRGFRLTLEQIIEFDQLNPLRAGILLWQETLHIPIIWFLIRILNALEMLDVFFEFLCVSFLLLWVEREHGWFFFLFNWLSWNIWINRVIANRLLVYIDVDSSDSKRLLTLKHVRILNLELSHQCFIIE